MNKLNNSIPVENSLEARNNPNNNTGQLRTVIRPPVDPDLANVIKEIEYLTSLGLTRNSDNEAMKTALIRYKELTRSDYVFPTTTPELAKVIQKLEYLTSLGLTRNSDNEAMKTALIEYHSLTGNDYVFPSVITTVAGDGFVGFRGMGRYGGDGGPATSASLYSPKGVAVDGGGNLFIADTGNNRIRRVAAGTGNITTVAGTGVEGFSGDGGPATSAALAYPSGVTVDGGGNVLIADTYNSCIRRVAAGTGVITTIAGTGRWGFNGDGRAATETMLNYPLGVAVDGGGNIFIADTNNHRIRRVAADTGVITTVAGTGTLGFSGDGGAAMMAALTSPTELALDDSGNIFVICELRVRKVDASGNITTLAGNGVYGFSGDGGPATEARLAWPSGLAVDGSGNVLFSDAHNNRIRRVEAGTGVITTLVGGAATRTNLTSPDGLALDTNGNLFIAEPTMQRIRKVSILLPAQVRSGGRRKKMKKSRRVKRSRQVRKSRRVRKSKI